MPLIIAAFVKAKNDRDKNAVVACFADDAVVQDEGQEMHGLTAIKEWSHKSFQKYQFTIDPTGIVEGDKEIILTATLTATFRSRWISTSPSKITRSVG